MIQLHKSKEGHLHNLTRWLVTANQGEFTTPVIMET